MAGVLPTRRTCAHLVVSAAAVLPVLPLRVRSCVPEQVAGDRAAAHAGLEPLVPAGRQGDVRHAFGHLAETVVQGVLRD